MILNRKEFAGKGVPYTVRSAMETDAQALSALRVQIDGETEYMDREQGEAYIDPAGFEQLIKADAEKPRNLFLVAAVEERIVGFSRCEGVYLKRFSHKAEFGICILREFWGCGIGKSLLQESVSWADVNGIAKLTLNVLETNEKAIQLYKRFGFEVEGVLKNDRLHADKNYYNTIVMGRWKQR